MRLRDKAASAVMLSVPELRDEVRRVLRVDPSLTVAQVARAVREREHRVKRLHSEIRRELAGARGGRRLSRPAVGEAIEVDLMAEGPADRWVTRIAILGRARALGFAPEIDRLEVVVRELEALGVLEVSSAGVRLTQAGIVWQRSGWTSSSLPRRARKRCAS